jgi:hypothetical protein
MSDSAPEPRLSSERNKYLQPVVTTYFLPLNTHALSLTGKLITQQREITYSFHLEVKSGKSRKVFDLQIRNMDLE